MEHGGGLAARTCVLDVDATEAIGAHRCRQIHDMRQRAIPWTRRRGLHMSSEQTADDVKTNGATSTITG